MDKKVLKFKGMCDEVTNKIRDFAGRGFEHTAINGKIYPAEIASFLLKLGFNYAIRNGATVIDWHDAKDGKEGKIYGKDFESTKYNFFEKYFDITKVKLFDEMPHFHPIYYIEIFATEAKEISDEKPIPYDTNPFTKPNLWK